MIVTSIIFWVNGSKDGGFIMICHDLSTISTKKNMGTMRFESMGTGWLPSWTPYSVKGYISICFGWFNPQNLVSHCGSGLWWFMILGFPHDWELTSPYLLIFLAVVSPPRCQLCGDSARLRAEMERWRCHVIKKGMPRGLLRLAATGSYWQLLVVAGSYWQLLVVAGSYYHGQTEVWILYYLYSER